MATARYLESDERAKLLAQLHSTRDRLLWILGINTGFRITELLSLRWRDVWREGAPSPTVQVTRCHLKGGRSRARKAIRSRVVPLNAAAAEALRAHAFAIGGSGGPPLEGWLFASQKRWPGVISRRHAYHIVTSAAQSAGLLPGVGTHTWRRVFCTTVYELSGHDITLTQKAMSHRSVLSTQQYLQRTDAQAAKIIQALAHTFEPSRSDLPSPRISPA